MYYKGIRCWPSFADLDHNGSDSAARHSPAPPAAPPSVTEQPMQSHGNGGNLLQSTAATSPHDEGFLPKVTPVSFSSGLLLLFWVLLLMVLGRGDGFCTLGTAGAKKIKIHSYPVLENIKHISALAI